VLVSGKAYSQNTKSPLKRKSCSLWQVEIEGRQYYPQWRKYYWSTLYNQTSQEPFEIIDKTGKVRIIPANAQLILHDDFRKSSNFLSPLPPHVKSAIEELGVMTIDAPGVERQLRVFERIVKPQDEIYIMGEVHFENGSKVIKYGKRVPFTISDRGEDEVLGALFKQTIVNFVFTIVISVVLFFFLRP